MNIWLIKDGELLPVQDDVRKMRTWMLAERLLERGHSVVWWSSTFSHQLKRQLYSEDTEIKIQPRFTLKMLNAGVYRKNVSVERIVHHWRLSRKFLESALRMPAPDVIVCSYPIIELALKCVEYSRLKSVPLVVDIRDQWPATFLRVGPRLLKPLVMLLVRDQYRKAREVMAKADRLVSVSQGFLRWGQDMAGRADEAGHMVFHIGYEADSGQAGEIPAQSERIRGLRDIVSGKTVFTYIGSFGHSYELGIVLDVAEKLSANGSPRVHFVIAGDGLQFETLRRRAEALPNVSLPGWLDRSEINGLLGISHVGLVPVLNIDEGRFPNKPFEYFAGGLPVLSSIDGEIKEFITANDVGFNYECGDVDGLYDLVGRMAGDETLRKRQGENAKRIFDEKFRADVIYGEYASFVEEVAAQKG